MFKQDLPIEKYFELKSLIEREGLFKRNYLYYFSLLSLISLGFFISLYTIIYLPDILWLQIINAFFSGFLVVQSGMLAHDFSHNQVFDKKLYNQIGAYFVWGVWAGITSSKWYENHNTHHKHVNQDGKDPDISGIPFIFEKEQESVLKDYKDYAWVIRYQHYFFWLVLPLAYYYYVQRSIAHSLLHGKLLDYLELFTMLLRQFIFYFIVFYFLDFSTAILFTFFHIFMGGYYMSMVFAPNHKGMEVVPSSEEVKWYHQIICTRNLFPSTFVFHMMGGLNYQIEHHLFTNVPRSSLPKIGKITKDFCLRNKIPYYETTWLGSVREIYVGLKENSVLYKKM